MKPLCSDACGGLCTVCGGRRDAGVCGVCQEAPARSGLGDLAGLLGQAGR